MLYLFTGNDASALADKLAKARASFEKKHPNALRVETDASSFSAATLDELTTASSLFSTAALCICNRLSENTEAATYLEEHAEKLAASHAFFLVLEPTEKETKLTKKLTKHAQKTIRRSARAQPETGVRDSDRFALAESFALRDRQKAWTLLARILQKDNSPEHLAQLHGLIVWQIKTVVLMKCIASGTQPASAAKSLKPNVRSKAERLAKAFSPNEATALLSSLIAAYHEERRGGPELSLALERIALSL